MNGLCMCCCVFCLGASVVSLVGFRRKATRVKGVCRWLYHAKHDTLHVQWMTTATER